MITVYIAFLDLSSVTGTHMFDTVKIAALGWRWRG
jgi:hypothetical protein